MATRNHGKIKEIAKILADLDIELIGLDAFPPLEIIESGRTFAENARLKAKMVCQHTGLVSLADDSGLSVQALGGAPGVYSARYSGPGATDQSNNDKLLRELAAVPDDKRQAAFHCHITVRTPDGRQLDAAGVWPGLISRQPAGTNGFGYDPLFFDPELKLTAAQMDADLKNQRSHRARALRQLADRWPDFFGK